MTHHEPNSHSTLSPEGMRKRDAIRDAACKATADRKRGARSVSVAALALVPISLIVTVWTLMSAGPGAIPGHDETLAGDGQPVIEKTTPDEFAAKDSPYQNLRFSIVKASNVKVVAIDDDELLDLLAQAGRPSGLIRVGDRVQVIEHARAGRPATAMPVGRGAESGGD